jgi:HYR domain
VVVSRGRIAALGLCALALGGTLVSTSSGEVAAPAKPTVLTDLPPWTKSTEATFQFSSSANATGFVCRRDTSPAGGVPCTSPTSYSSLAQGEHFFQVRAVDSSGDVSTPTTFEWTIDLTAPSVPTNIVAEAVSPAGAIVVFAASDNLDPSPLLNCGAHGSGSTFPLGTTEVSCTATDAAGNASSGSFSVTVRDSTRPTLASHPDVIRAQQSPQGAVVDYALPVARDAADPSPVVECNPPPGSLFPIGETEVTCTATDAADLVSAPVRFKVVVQQGAIPTKPGIAASVPKLTNRTQATFELTIAAGVSAECSLDGPPGPGSFAPCSAGTARTYTGLVEGAYLFTVQVTNAIGNVNQASYGWAVDLTSPDDVARFSARAGDRIVRLSWTKPIDVDYERVRLWRKRAGATSWRRLADRAAADTFLDREVSNHVRYVYRIRSFDLAGNVSAASTASAWPTPILSPVYDAIVHSPPLVDWRSVRNATYYNMQMWRNGRKLLSVWPSGSQYRLRSSWTFQGRRHMLSGGQVTVYVWAGFGSKAAANYGPLYGRTRFTVG